MRGIDRCIQSDFIADVCQCLAVTQGLKRFFPACAAVGEERFDLLDKAARKHLTGPFVQSFIERSAIGIETNSQHAIVRQRSCLYRRRRSVSAEKTNLNRSHQPLRIVLMNPLSGGRIETREKPSHAANPPLFANHQPFTHGPITFGQVRKPFKERAKIKAGSTDDHGKTIAGGDFMDGLPGDARVLTCGVTVRGVEHVQQAMGDSAAFGLRSLGGADVEPTVELEGIAIDDFAGKVLANAQRERALSSACGAGDDNEGGLCVGMHLLPSYPAGPPKPIY